jgi:hypothetical protein
MTDPFVEFMYSKEIILKMPDRFRGLLRRMSSGETKILNPVAAFTEKWKNVHFSTPLYSRLVYKMYNYLNNPELNLEYSQFVANADIMITMLSDVLGETRTRLESNPSQTAFVGVREPKASALPRETSTATPEPTVSEGSAVAADEFQILLFITEFLSL